MPFPSYPPGTNPGLHPPSPSPYIGPGYIPRAEDLPSSGPGPGTPEIPPNPAPEPEPIGGFPKPRPTPPGLFPLDPPGTRRTPVDEFWGFRDGDFPLGTTPAARLAQPIKQRHDRLYDLFDDITRFIQSFFISANADLNKVPIDATNTRFVGNVEGQRRVLMEVQHQRKLNIYKMQGMALDTFERNVAVTPKADGVEIIKAPSLLPNRPDKSRSVVHADINRPVRGRRSVAQIVPVELADYVESWPDSMGETLEPQKGGVNITTSKQAVRGIARNELDRERKESSEPKWQNTLFLIAAFIVAIMILRKV